MLLGSYKCLYITRESAFLTISSLFLATFVASFLYNTAKIRNFCVTVEPPVSGYPCDLKIVTALERCLLMAGWCLYDSGVMIKCQPKEKEKKMR